MSLVAATSLSDIVFMLGKGVAWARETTSDPITPVTSQQPEPSDGAARVKPPDVAVATVFKQPSGFAFKRERERREQTGSRLLSAFV
jgi:hypothetical protein